MQHCLRCSVCKFNVNSQFCYFSECHDLWHGLPSDFLSLEMTFVFSGMHFHCVDVYVYSGVSIFPDGEKYVTVL